jgi:membrane fusion protein, macrolide-specific efflux system
VKRSPNTIATDGLRTGMDARAGVSSDRAPVASTPSRARRPRRLRRWLVAAAGIVVLAGVAYALTRGKTHSYVLGSATNGTVTQTVSVSGALAPTRFWDLYFPTAGTIAQLDVSAGQQVQAGQVLAVLNTRPLQTQVSSAQAGVAAAQAKVDADQAHPAADYAVASAQTSADEDALTAAEDQLATAKANLAGATLRAPAAATVAQVNLAVGQNLGGDGGGGGASEAGGAGAGGSGQASASASAAATPTSGASSPAITLEDPRSFEAVGQVSDTQIAQLHVHQQVLVTPAGHTGAIHGQVRAITPTPTNSGGVITYPIEITWPGHPPGLYDGMSAEISIVVAQMSGLTVPSSAVHTDGTHSWVIVLHGARTRNGRARGGQATRQPIVLGPSGGGLTEVRSGLQAGEQVVLADNSTALPSASSSSQGKGGEVKKLFGG